MGGSNGHMLALVGMLIARVAKAFPGDGSVVERDSVHSRGKKKHNRARPMSAKVCVG